MTALYTSSPHSALQTEKLLKLIQADGLLCRSLKGFEPRPQQQQMMANVIDAYNHDHIALIEAGTGTGKSLAYLIPAMLWAAGAMNGRSSPPIRSPFKSSSSIKTSPIS